MKRLLMVVPLLLVLTACPKVEQDARDTAAALGGAIKAAQVQHQAECQAAVAEGNQTCQLINRAVDAQNALVTATEAYCGWSTGAPPSDPNAKCVAVSGAQAGLQAAINNANQFVTELRGVINK